MSSLPTILSGSIKLDAETPPPKKRLRRIYSRKEYDRTKLSHIPALRPIRQLVGGGRQGVGQLASPSQQDDDESPECAASSRTSYDIYKCHYLADKGELPIIGNDEFFHPDAALLPDLQLSGDSSIYDHSFRRPEQKLVFKDDLDEETARSHTTSVSSTPSAEKQVPRRRTLGLPPFLTSHKTPTGPFKKLKSKIDAEGNRVTSDYVAGDGFSKHEASLTGFSSLSPLPKKRTTNLPASKVNKLNLTGTSQGAQNLRNNSKRKEPAPAGAVPPGPSRKGQQKSQQPQHPQQSQQRAAGQKLTTHSHTAMDYDTTTNFNRSKQLAPSQTGFLGTTSCGSVHKEKVIDGQANPAESDFNIFLSQSEIHVDAYGTNLAPGEPPRSKNQDTKDDCYMGMNAQGLEVANDKNGPPITRSERNSRHTHLPAVHGELQGRQQGGNSPASVEHIDLVKTQGTRPFSTEPVGEGRESREVLERVSSSWETYIPETQPSHRSQSQPQKTFDIGIQTTQSLLFRSKT